MVQPATEKCLAFFKLRMLWLRKDYLNRNRKILLILKWDIWKHKDNLWRLVHRQEKSGKGGRQRKGKEIEGEAKVREKNLNYV